MAFTCPLAATNPNFLITIGGVNYCDQSNGAIPWRTQFKLVGTVPLPWYGIMLSGSYQALPGYLIGTQALTQGGAGAPNLTAPSGLGSTWTVTAATKYVVCPGNSAAQGCVLGATVVPGLLSSSLSVPLVQPGTEQTPRLNQVDFSIAKRITVGRFRFDPKIDLFNALNSDGYFTPLKTQTFTPIAAGVAPTGLNGSGGSYLLPASVIQGRIVRIGLVLNW